MFKALPILAAAAIVVAMSVPASADNRPRVHNVTVDNSNYDYGLGGSVGPVLYPQFYSDWRAKHPAGQGGQRQLAHLRHSSPTIIADSSGS